MKCILCDDGITEETPWSEYKGVRYHKFCILHAIGSKTLLKDGSIDEKKLPLLKEYINSDDLDKATPYND